MTTNDQRAVPRWLKLAMFLGMLVLLAGGVWFHEVQRRTVRRDVEANLSTIAASKVAAIAAWRTQRLDDAAVLSGSLFFGVAAARWMAMPGAAPPDGLLARLRVTCARYEYGGAALIDLQGCVRLQTGMVAAALGPAASACVVAAIRERRPVLSDLQADAEGAPPHIDVAAPLFASDAEGAAPVGAVLLRADAARELYPLIQFWPVATRTAEHLLVRREGDDVLFLNELRHRSNMALRLREPLTRTDLPAVMAVLGRRGVVEGLDYRRVPVLAVLKAVPDSDWFLVTKVDRAEAFAGWRMRSFLILSLYLGLVAAMAAAGGLVWHRQYNAHYREMYHAETARRASESRYRTTLLSVGDGVIATDAAGTVDLLNPVAETLTGWSTAEARGRPLEEVFRIVNQATRLPVENPVRHVIQAGKVVGLANHSLLIARDGTARPIADSGAPIRDADGTVVGVVLVFRDVSAEHHLLYEREAALRALDAERQFLRMLIDTIPDVVFAKDTQRRFTLGNTAMLANLDVQRQEDFIDRTAADFFPKERAESIEHDDRQVLLSGQSIINREDQTDTRSGRKGWQLSTKVPLRNTDGIITGMLGIARDITELHRLQEENARVQAHLLQAHKMESVGRLAGGVAHDFNNMLQAILGHTELALTETPPGSPFYESLRQIEIAAQRSANLTSKLLAFARRQAVQPRVLNLNDTVAQLLGMLGRLLGENIELTWRPAHDLWPVRIDPSQVDQILTNLAVNARDAITGAGRITIETANTTLDENYSAQHPDTRPGDYVMLTVNDTGCGMDAETLAQAFEPFFTTKARGSGFGLAIVYGIIKQNAGAIHAYSEPGKGSAFRLYLPRHAAGMPASAADAASTKTAAPPIGTETLLLVEDEEIVRTQTRQMLARLGYVVLAAATPGEAIRLLQEHAGAIDLLITDVVMPEMNGRELAERLAGLQPGLKCLYISGYTDDVIAHHGILDTSVHFIQKPFSMPAIAGKIRETLGAA